MYFLQRHDLLWAKQSVFSSWKRHWDLNLHHNVQSTGYWKL